MHVPKPSHPALNHFECLSEHQSRWNGSPVADQSAYRCPLWKCWTVVAAVVCEAVNEIAICYDCVRHRGQENETCEQKMNWHAEMAANCTKNNSRLLTCRKHSRKRTVLKATVFQCLKLTAFGALAMLPSAGKSIRPAAITPQQFQRVLPDFWATTGIKQNISNTKKTSQTEYT